MKKQRSNFSILALDKINGACRFVRLTATFFPNTDCTYFVYSALPGAISEGAGIDEATENIRDIISDFLPERVNASTEDE